MPISIGTTTVTALFLGTTSITSAHLGNTQVFGGSFTPLSLFSGGAQGIWLDPSDLTTMFSDRAGTTPVTAPGTVVGLRLDKSKGLALGAELVANGDFSSGTDGWSKQPNVTWSVVDGVLNAIASVNSSNGVYASFSVVAGKTYRFSGSLANIASAVGYGIRIGASSFGYSGEYGVFLTWGGSVFFTPTATGTCFVWVGVNFSGLTTTLDNISVRELPGNHATAPTDAARPIYGVEPKGGRRNLLLNTDTLSTQSVTVTNVLHVLSFSGTGTVTLSGVSTAGPLVGTGAGNRVYLEFTPTAGSLTLTVSGSVTFAQLERG